jgi:hypothetical protein
VIGDAFGPKLLALQEQAWEREDSTLVLIAGALVRSIGLLVRGRVKLPRSRVGGNLTMQDGKAFRIFRQVRSNREPRALPEVSSGALHYEDAASRQRGLLVADDHGVHGAAWVTRQDVDRG